MDKKINPDNDSLDLSEEYFNKKYITLEHSSDEYFPEDGSKPPHY